MNEKRPSIEESRKWLAARSSAGSGLCFDMERQAFVAADASGGEHKLTLPLICPAFGGGEADVDTDVDTNDVLVQFQTHRLAALIILVQAGYAALGYCEGDALIRHKMVKKYMVRQSQGKSQISYKKSKGKSRLGSRIRLHNSVVFFEEINQTLRDWNVLTNCDRILMSLPVNLTHLLYTSKVPPPFEKKDPRIVRIPLNVKTPSYKELCHIHWEVTHGHLASATGSPPAQG